MDILDTLSKYLDIDTRLALNIPPRKLDTRYFEFIVSFRRPVIYMKDTQTLFIFEQSQYTILKPLIMTECDDITAIFQSMPDYNVEYITERGTLWTCPIHDESVQIDTKFLKIV
jgi:hypothetical protein